MDVKENCYIINKCCNKNRDSTNKLKHETKSHSKYYSQNPSVKIESNLSNVKNRKALVLIMSIMTKCKSFHQDFIFSTHLIQNGNFLWYAT